MIILRGHAEVGSDESGLARGVVPLYAQLARILRTQISSGELKPGDPLATEEGMCQAFGVSRVTVREALRLLTEEGLIVKAAGTGHLRGEALRAGGVRVVGSSTLYG